MKNIAGSKSSKFFSYTLLVLGILKLADGLYGGVSDFGGVMSGVGFLLMTPAVFAGADPAIASRFANSGRSNILMPMGYLGAALAIAGILMRWF